MNESTFLWIFKEPFFRVGINPEMALEAQLRLESDKNMVLLALMPLPMVWTVAVNFNGFNSNTWLTAGRKHILVDNPYTKLIPGNFFWTASVTSGVQHPCALLLAYSS
jgi:hypothetical protein